MIVFFVMMQSRRIFKFKAQRRWLEMHRKTAFWLSKAYQLRDQALEQNTRQLVMGFWG